MNYRDQTLDEFLSEIASERVAPAGGTATAVVGAVGAALCEMVCIHTVENDDGDVETTALVEVRDDLNRQRGHLLQLADTDGRLVDDLFGADSGDVEQPEVKRSIGVPLTIADSCLNVLELATDVTETGNRNAVADAATGVILTRSALGAAVFTVRSNVDQVSDASFVEDVERDVAEIENRGENAYERAMRNVEERT
jgi:formiminotetrahydrofolate cyclodeaminase